MLDVLVIGAGQAGLAIGRELGRRGLRLLIVDAADRVGATWRQRWDSLVLFTPTQYDSLPGLAFPGAKDHYPGKDEVADYLDRYAAEFDLPVRLNTAVISLVRDNDGYLAAAGADRFRARQVVIATGPFQTPAIPALSKALDRSVHQVHSADYRDPEALPPGRVLVVGGANSGSQIARELAATRQVTLAVGARNPVLPQRPLGRDIWWWAKGLRFDRITVQSRLGRRLAGRDPVFGDGPRRLARRHGVSVRPRLTSADGRRVTFEDGTTTDIDVVVWATGFDMDHTWVDVPGVLDERGRIRQSAGVTDSPGLYTIGLPWQRTRGSALLGWIGNDAADLAERIQLTAHDSARPRGGNPAVSPVQAAQAPS